jgi:hypothetical protein
VDKIYKLSSSDGILFLPGKDLPDYTTSHLKNINLHTHRYTYTEKKLRGLSPQAKYTDRATAAVGEVVPTVAGRGCYVVSATDSYGRYLGFLDRSRYFFFQVAPQL